MNTVECATAQALSLRGLCNVANRFGIYPDGLLPSPITKEDIHDGIPSPASLLIKENSKWGVIDEANRVYMLLKDAPRAKDDADFTNECDLRAMLDTQLKDHVSTYAVLLAAHMTSVQIRPFETASKNYLGADIGTSLAYWERLCFGEAWDEADYAEFIRDGRPIPRDLAERLGLDPDEDMPGPEYAPWYEQPGATGIWLRDVLDTLAFLDPDMDRNEWRKIIGALHWMSAGGTYGDKLRLFNGGTLADWAKDAARAFSACNSFKFSDGSFERHWNGLDADHPNPTAWGTVEEMALRVHVEIQTGNADLKRQYEKRRSSKEFKEVEAKYPDYVPCLFKEKPSNVLKDGADLPPRNSNDSLGAQGHLITVRMEDVEEKKLAWFWKGGGLPLQSLAVVCGFPGCGKTTMLCNLIAQASIGTRPCGERLEPCDVLLLSAEDPIDTVLKPRLRVAGANMKRVYAIKAVKVNENDEYFDLKKHVGYLSEHLTHNPAIRLVVIDPINAFLGGVDSHNDASLRTALGPLAALAEERDVCVVLIVHPRKMGGKAEDIINGSRGYVGAARSVWFLVDEFDEDGNKTGFKLYMPAKANWTEENPGWRGRVESVEGEEDQARFVFEGNADGANLDEQISWRNGGGDKRLEAPARDEAQAWLVTFLGDGEKPLDEIKESAEAADISWETLKRASQRLKVSKRSEGFGKDKVSYWSLPLMAIPLDGTHADEILGGGKSRRDWVRKKHAQLMDECERMLRENPLPQPKI